MRIKPFGPPEHPRHPRHPRHPTVVFCHLLHLYIALVVRSMCSQFLAPHQAGIGKSDSGLTGVNRRGSLTM